jgi:hypothetical protein
VRKRQGRIRPNEYDNLTPFSLFPYNFKLLVQSRVGKRMTTVLKKAVSALKQAAPPKETDDLAMSTDLVKKIIRLNQK